MPVICPTCQLAFEASVRAARTFAWGCFQYLGSRLRVGPVISTITWCGPIRCAAIGARAQMRWSGGMVSSDGQVTTARARPGAWPGSDRAVAILVFALLAAASFLPVLLT